MWCYNIHKVVWCCFHFAIERWQYLPSLMYSCSLLRHRNTFERQQRQQIYSKTLRFIWNSDSINACASTPFSKRWVSSFVAPSKALQQIEGEKLLPKACLHLTHLQQYFFESQKNYELQFRFTKDWISCSIRMVMLLLNNLTLETILVYLKQKSGKKAILKARNEARKYIILDCIYMGVISEKNLYILSYKFTV